MMSGSSRIEAVARIDYPVAAYRWPFLDSHAAQIDAHWAKMRETRPGLFNGRVLLMHGDAIDSGEEPVLRGIAFETDYKAFVSWRAFDFPDETVTNTFAMTALRSADGAFMLGRMGLHTAAPGRIYFPAGTPDLSDIVNGAVDFHGSALRELKEETGIEAAELTLDSGWHAVFRRRYLACMKPARSALSAKELVARFEAFRAAEHEPELTAFVPVFSEKDFDADAMPVFMRDYMRAMF